jgi:hypothetical protein
MKTHVGKPICSIPAHIEMQLRRPEYAGKVVAIVCEGRRAEIVASGKNENSVYEELHKKGILLENCIFVRAPKKAASRRSY